jgi:hypothetical protein
MEGGIRRSGRERKGFFHRRIGIGVGIFCSTTSMIQKETNKAPTLFRESHKIKSNLINTTAALL